MIELVSILRWSGIFCLRRTGSLGKFHLKHRNNYFKQRVMAVFGLFFGEKYKNMIPGRNYSSLKIRVFLEISKYYPI